MNCLNFENSDSLIFNMFSNSVSVKTTLLSINVSYSDFVEAAVNLSVISVENFFSEAKCPNPAIKG